MPPSVVCKTDVPKKANGAPRDVKSDSYAARERFEDMGKWVVGEETTGQGPALGALAEMERKLQAGG